MFALRSIRLIPSYFSRCPIVDKATKCKGGHSRNIYVLSCLHTAVPCTNYSHLSCPYDPAKKFQVLHSFSTSSRCFKEESLSQTDLKKAVDDLTDQFMETRELLEDAGESAGTVYFSDDMKEASESVTKTLEDYQELLNKLSDEQRQEVLRTIGLKMEELKAQQQALEEDQ